MSTKVVLLGGEDITDLIEFGSAEFTAAVNGRAGTCSFFVKDVNQAKTFVVGKELTLDVDGIRSWGGYCLQIERAYYFPVDATPGRVALVPRHLKISGADYNILFEKRVVYDKADPTQGNIPVDGFPAGTFDNVVVQSIIDNNLDLSGDGLTTDLQHVGTPNTDDIIVLQAGWNWSTAMRFLTSVTGAIYYIRPDKTVVLADVVTINSPFEIADRPSAFPNSIGCRDLEILFDGSQLINDALVWGAGQGNINGVFSRVTDGVSVSDHGLWQVGAPLQTIWKQTTADRIANTYVYGSPQSQRGAKDDRIAIKCSIFTAGIVCGQVTTLHTAVYGLDFTLPIRYMRITFPTATDVKWELDISAEIDIPWAGFDIFPFPPLPPIIPPIVPIFPPHNPCSVLGAGYFAGGSGGAFSADHRSQLGQINDDGLGFDPGPPPRDLWNWYQVSPNPTCGPIPYGIGNITLDHSLTASYLDSIRYQFGGPAESFFSMGSRSFAEFTDWRKTNSGSNSIYPGAGKILRLQGTLTLKARVEDRLRLGSADLVDRTNPNPTPQSVGLYALPALPTGDIVGCGPHSFSAPAALVEYSMMDGDSIDFEVFRSVQDDNTDVWLATQITTPQYASDIAYFDAQCTITDAKFFDVTPAGTIIQGYPCADPGNQLPGDPPLGPFCQILTRIPTPPSADPSLTYFQADGTYLYGSTEVWVGGLRIAWYDYDEIPNKGQLVMHANVNVGGGDPFDPPKTVFACMIGG